jgi:dienelactone hydrolase
MNAKRNTLLGGTVTRRLRALVVGLMVGTLVAAPARAQQPGLYRWFQNGMEVGRETVRRLPDGVEFSAIVPLVNLKVDSRFTYDAAGHFAWYEGRLFNAAGDSLRATYTARQDGDSLRAQADQRGHTSARTIAGRADAVIPPQSIALFALAAERAAGRDTVFRMLPMGTDSLVPVSARFGPDSVSVTLGPVVVRTAFRDGRTGPVIEVPISRVRAELWSGGDSLPPLSGLHRPRPDYSASPDAPFTAEDLRVPVRPARGDTFSLGCTLTRPKTGGPRFPAVVTATGSGLEDRDENLWPLVPAYRPLRDVAERLARTGIAVLRCDDRSFGGSTGRADSATTADFADDMRAQIAWLRARPDILPRKIAALGHSEGGLIGPMVAASDPQLAALVVMAGTAKAGRDVLHYQLVERPLADTTLSAAQRDSLRPALERQVSQFLSANAWTRFFADYDPTTTARRVRQPTLILQGGVDRQVTAGQADTLAEAMREGGNRDVTVRVFPGLNHLFLVSPSGTGDPAEYATLREVALPREVLDTLATWLAAKLHP